MSLRKTGNSRENDLIEYVKNSVISKIKTESGVPDESQNVIKV